MQTFLNSNNTIHLGNTYATSASNSGREVDVNERKQQAPTSSPTELFAAEANVSTAENSSSKNRGAPDLQFPVEFLTNYPPVISK